LAQQELLQLPPFARRCAAERGVREKLAAPRAIASAVPDELTNATFDYGAPPTDARAVR